MKDPVIQVVTLLRLILVALCVLVGATIYAKAQEHSHEHMEGHAQFHTDFYQKWNQPNGTSCCNDADCAPLAYSDFRIRGEDIEVRIEEEWIHVAKEKIRPYIAPDLSSHLCHVGKTIFCFVFGGGT